MKVRAMILIRWHKRTMHRNNTNCDVEKEWLRDVVVVWQEKHRSIELQSSRHGKYLHDKGTQQSA